MIFASQPRVLRRFAVLSNLSPNVTCHPAGGDKVSTHARDWRRTIAHKLLRSERAASVSCKACAVRPHLCDGDSFFAGAVQWPSNHPFTQQAKPGAHLCASSMTSFLTHLLSLELAGNIGDHNTAPGRSPFLRFNLEGSIAAGNVPSVCVERSGLLAPGIRSGSEKCRSLGSMRYEDINRYIGGLLSIRTRCIACASAGLAAMVLPIYRTSARAEVKT
jgi:hypothetical protein